MKYFFLKILKKSLIGCIGVTSFLYPAEAQTNIQFSHFLFSKLAYNPAAAGLEDNISSTFILRNQWLGVNGNPTTQYLGVSMPVYVIKSGLGINIINEKLGLEKTTSVNVSFAYRKKVSFGRLSLGINGGFIQKSLDGMLLRAPEGEYEGGIIAHNDNNIPVTNVNNIVPDVAVGFYFDSKNLDIGLSLLNGIQSKLNFDIVDIILKRHIYFMGSYTNKLTDFVKLKSSTFFRTDLTKTQIDLSALVEYNNFIWGGLLFRGLLNRNIDALSFLAGVNIYKELAIGYSYDLSLSAFSPYQAGSHELMIKYNFVNQSNKKNTYEPRFF